jgi:aldehyde dehydrogenase (NAD+)
MTAPALPFETQHLFIAGQWRAAQAGQTLPLDNPSDGSVLCRIARGRAEDVDAAVAAAQAARARRP